MVRPATIAQAVKGKLLSSVANFVATFNYIAKYVCNLTANNGLAITGINLDKPTVGLVGFAAATEGQVPSKSGKTIAWVTPSSNIKVIGTDGTYAIVGDPNATDFKTLTFASASNSNVVATVTGTDGSATVTIGVYYS